MDNLIKEMHEAGIHVIMDFVLNHTSDQHPGFKMPLKILIVFIDYYILPAKIISDQIIGKLLEVVFGKDPASRTEVLFSS